MPEMHVCTEWLYTVANACHALFFLISAYWFVWSARDRPDLHRWYSSCALFALSVACSVSPVLRLVHPWPGHYHTELVQLCLTSMLGFGVVMRWWGVRHRLLQMPTIPKRMSEEDAEIACKVYRESLERVSKLTESLEKLNAGKQ